MDAPLPPVATACALALVSAFLVVLSDRAIRAVVALLAHSLAIAALYALLAAGLVAVGQLLIYSGAIVVLFLFVVALLPPGGRELSSQPLRVTAGVLVGLVMLAALYTGLEPALFGNVQLAAAAGPIGSVAGVGHKLFDFAK